MSSNASGDVPLCPNCHRPRAVRNAPRCTYCGMVFAPLPPSAPPTSSDATGPQEATQDATLPAGSGTGAGGDATRPHATGAESTRPASGAARPVKPIYISRVPNLYADAPPPPESSLPSWLRGTSGLLVAFCVFLVILFVAVFWAIKRHTPDEDSWQIGKGEIAGEIQQSQQAMDEMRARQAGLPYGAPVRTQGAQGLHPALAPLTEALEEYARDHDRYPSRLSPEASELVRYVDTRTALKGLRDGAFQYSLVLAPDGRSETYTLSARLPNRDATPVEWRETWNYRYVMQAPSTEDVSRGIPPPPPAPTSETGADGGDNPAGTDKGFNP